MVITSTGQISFTDIQNEFGGKNPIEINEYYQNASNGLTSGVSGIPNMGSAISLSDFRGKSKSLEVILQGSTIKSIPNTDFSYAVFTNTSVGTNKISFDKDIETDVLIVGGGGGGGAGWATNRDWGGGYPGIGGYGGEFKETKIKFLKDRQYDIIIGKGGETSHQYGGNFSSGTGNGRTGGQSKIKYNSNNVITSNGGGGGSPQWLRHWKYATGASGGMDGKASSITGVSTWYAAAGGNGSGWITDNNDSRYAYPGKEIGTRNGGKGGGGAPGRQTSSDRNGKAAVANTGSGGGGAAGYTSSYPTIRDIGGKGADGIVIIRWKA
jgi:hypothetical protein